MKLRFTSLLFHAKILSVTFIAKQIGTLHECEVCKKKFCRKYRLRKHKQSVHQIANEKAKEGPIVCKYCPEEFAGRHLMWQHVKSEHRERVKLLPCDICDKKLMGKRRLEQHKVTTLIWHRLVFDRISQCVFYLCCLKCS